MSITIPKLKSEGFQEKSVRKIISTLVSCSIILVGAPSLAFAGCGQISSPMTTEAILNRIKPVGGVDVEGGGAPKAVVAEALSASAGEDRYKSTCSVCHETGVGGAPKFRNEADWKPRMEAGLDGMLKIAIQGKGAMPPKGTCMQCSDEELRMTIQYMIPQKK